MPALKLDGVGSRKIRPQQPADEIERLGIARFAFFLDGDFDRGKGVVGLAGERDVLVLQKLLWHHATAVFFHLIGQIGTERRHKSEYPVCSDRIIARSVFQMANGNIAGELEKPS